MKGIRVCGRQGLRDAACVDTPAVCTFQETTPTSHPHQHHRHCQLPLPQTSQIHSHIQAPSVKSIHMYTCKPTKQHPLCNWLRIRAHGVLLNLWRLCVMLESVEIMQRRDIMPPFSLIASVLFPCLCYGDYPTHFIHLFLPNIVPHSLFTFLSIPFCCSAPFAPLPLLFPFSLASSLSSLPSASPSFGPLAVSPQVMFSWPDDACISLVSS